MKTRDVAEALTEEFARDCWHEDETVYARFPTLSRHVVRDVVQSQLICTVAWARVPPHHFLEAASWKWWCWIPEPLLMCIGRIDRLKEWLLWEVHITREQLLWFAKFMADHQVKLFLDIEKWNVDAAAYMHMGCSDVRKMFWKEVKTACQARSDHAKKVNAPELSEEAKHRRDCALRLGLIRE